MNAEGPPRLCPVMGWSGRAPAPPAMEAGKGRGKPHAEENEAALSLIVLQNSKNGLERFFREKRNQATIADRCVLKRATEVACEFITSCCGPPHDYSIA